MVFFKIYKHHLFILFIAIAWIVFFDFLTQMSSQGVMHSDSSTYLAAAQNLYIFYCGQVYRPILMAAITGIPYLFGGSDENIFTFSFYVNLLCWFTSLLLLYEILKAFVTPRISFVVTISAIFIVG